jgi:hypothetical protein
MMKKMRIVLLAIWSAASIWAADVHPATPKPAAAKPVARASASDAQIEAAIRAKLAKSKIATDKFTVHVQGGVATFEGRTDVLQHKGVATRMAKSAGAVAVKNNIQVSDDAKAEARGNLEEGRRRVQIKRGDARTEARSDAIKRFAQ